MIASDLAAFLARVVVILAAALAAFPLVRRSGRRRLTGGAITFGIVLALVPAILQVLQTIFKWRLSPSLFVLSRLDAPGFALILFGVVLALRDMSRTKDKLHQQNQVLKEDASTDYLTGLLNRRHAEFLLDYGAARARRSGDALGFIMIDLDHFKRVNDKLGHQAGDAVLAHVGRLLKSRMRGSDIVARYGGEEFLVVVPDPNPEGIAALAESLRVLIEQTPTECGGRPIAITASCGVAISLINTEEDLKGCIGKADAALYIAKFLGRNRVVSWEQTSQCNEDSAKDLSRRACAGGQLTARTS